MSRLSRRAFLQLGGLALGALWGPAPSTLRIASMQPLAGPHTLFTHLHTALHHLHPFDVALLPAPATARLIERGDLWPLPGGTPRPHDPEGAFTRPAGLTRLAVRFAGAAPVHVTLADVLTQRVAAPPEPRWAQAAWLVAHGQSPNTVHPGWQARAAQATAAWPEAPGASVTLTWLPLYAPLPSHTRWPAETVCLAWDWVVPRTSRHPQWAQAWAERHTQLAQPAPAGSFTLV